MLHRILLVSAFATALSLPALEAQEAERELCRDEDHGDLCPGEDCPCTDDRLEIVFQDQLDSSIFEYDDSFNIEEDFIRSRVVVDTVNDQIRGYSFGVRHDTTVINPFPGPRGLNVDGGPLMEDPATASDPARMGGFIALRVIAVDQVRQGYICAIVLHLSLPVVLAAPERNVVLNADYQLEADVGNEGTMLTLAGDLGDPAAQIVLTVDQLEFPEMVDKEEMNCIDEIDNDFDGFVDRDDPDCVVRTGVSKIPRTVVDAIIRGTCTPTEPDAEVTCDDGLDNDCDGDVDGADSDCPDGCESTEPEGEVTCDDGVDNDCDELTDMDDPDCIVVEDCPDWAFYFGTAATDADTVVELGDSYPISMRNLSASTGFQLGVRGTGAGPVNLELTGELGRDDDTLVELLIADNADPLPMGNAPDVVNMATAPAIGNSVARGDAIDDFPDGSDILLFDLIGGGNGGVGGEGFTVGYVSDINDDGTDNLIPATDTEGCPVNEILLVTGTPPFNRADSDGDGEFNVVDAVVIIQYVIMNIPAPFDCDDIFDANDNGMLELGDGLMLLNYLFMRGPTLAMPFRECGSDATDDTLDTCVESNCQ